jgi:hypothetical protein
MLHFRRNSILEGYKEGSVMPSMRFYNFIQPPRFFIRGMVGKGVAGIACGSPRKTPKISAKISQNFHQIHSKFLILERANY